MTHQAPCDGECVTLALFWSARRLGVRRLLLNNTAQWGARIKIESLQAEGVSHLEVPRLNPWGPSVSVNEVRGPTTNANESQAIEIEMQSGDVIKITAKSFAFPEGD
jgi:hypothetical protein